MSCPSSLMSGSGHFDRTGQTDPRQRHTVLLCITVNSDARVLLVLKTSSAENRQLSSHQC